MESLARTLNSLGGFTFKMLIQGYVTQNDIDTADRSRADTHCIIARALTRMFPQHEGKIYVGFSSVEIAGRMYWLDNAAMEQVSAWVFSKTIQPFDFTMREL